MKKIISLFAAATVFAAVAGDSYYQVPRVKLIHDGWGLQYQGLPAGATPDRRFQMTTEYIKNNVRMLESSIPGNGIVIRFITDASKCEGQPVSINAGVDGVSVFDDVFVHRVPFCTTGLPDGETVGSPTGF